MNSSGSYIGVYQDLKLNKSLEDAILGNSFW